MATNGAVVTSLGDLPPPTSGDSYAGVPAYSIGPFDKLTVSVFGVPDISGEVTVDPQGRVSVPLAGTIEAAGKSPAELADLIAAKLRNYVRDPNVTVGIKEAVSRTFTVDGQVKDPGVYQANGNLSLMRAIATAKGATEDADLSDVVVFRTVDGKQMAALYNLSAIRRGTYADPAIYPHDVIVVGDSPTSRMIRSLAPILATPLVLLLQ
ncbi:MAG: polysaccharide export protein [Alphaproteobacteria bacterium]|nr:MAG: polysaccharide export protein [Alphaproteobacteria bacterium]